MSAQTISPQKGTELGALCRGLQLSNVTVRSARTAPSAASPVSVLMGGNFVDTIKRVQDLMQARDMNLCVLAKKCGISYSTIQTTARRGGQLSVETIERICLGLGITLKDFFDSSYL